MNLRAYHYQHAMMIWRYDYLEKDDRFIDLLDAVFGGVRTMIFKAQWRALANIRFGFNLGR